MDGVARGSSKPWVLGHHQKWLLVGAAGSGKRTLLNAYLNDGMSMSADRNAATVNLLVDDASLVRLHTINVCVPRGVETALSLDDLCSDADAILLCSSARGHHSHEQDYIRSLLPSLRIASPNMKLIVVGTQIDCRTDTAVLDDLALLDPSGIRRCASSADFEAFASECCAHSFAECSSKVVDDLESLVQLVLETTLTKKLRSVSRPLRPPLARPAHVTGEMTGPMAQLVEGALEVELCRRLRQVPSIKPSARAGCRRNRRTVACRRAHPCTTRASC